jgi:hypothetical protein
MKIFTAMLCIIALAANTALATLGGISYCVEKDINGRVSYGCVRESPDPCCPDRDTRSKAFAQLLIDCDICVDGEVEASDLVDATSSFNRITVKAPLAITWISSAQWIRQRAEYYLEQRLPDRVPPAQLRASQQYADTIQFRC